MVISRVLVLINPIASRGRGGKSAEAIRLGLEANGVTPEMVMLPGPEAVRTSVRDYSGKVDAVIAVGGDGTLNSVVDAVHGCQPGLPVGLIPFGLANCMADELGLTADIERAAAIIAGGRTRIMDAALVEGRLTLAFWGAGFDARVAAGVAEHRTGAIRYGRYIRAAWWSFYRGEIDELRVEVDGCAIPGSFGQALLIQVRNFAHFFRFRGGPGFHLLLFRSGGRAALVRALTRCVFLGNLERASDVAKQVKESFRVRSERVGGHYQFDGEAGGELPAEGRILRGAVTYLVP